MSYFRNKVVLVTGAKGGFGREFVKQLSDASASLILSDMAGEANAPQGDAVRGFVEADLSTAAGCRSLVEEAFRLSPHIDILINNAGMAVIGEFAELGDAMWDKQVQVNLIAPLRLTHLALERMRERGRGQIVNIASLGAHLGTPRLATYTATKFALRGFGMAMQGELASQGISLCTAYPPLTRTPIIDSPRVGYVRGKAIPSYLLAEPEPVVRSILKGVARREPHIFPSVPTRLAYYLSRLSPAGLQAVANRVARTLD